MDRVEVHLGGNVRTLLVLLVPLTLGFGTLAVWLSMLNWPRLVDREGVTTRGGKRYAWSALTQVTPVTTVNRSGRRITGRLDLAFGKSKVQVVPHSLREGQQVMDLISSVLGQAVHSG
jgi:hypothetical protein